MCLAGVLGILLMRERGALGTNAARRLAVVAATGLAALVLFTNSSFLVRERATTLLQPGTVMGARGFLLGEVAPFLARHPLGGGMGKIVPSSQLLSDIAGVAPDAYASENMLFAMSVELGVIGAAFVIAFWFVIARRAVRRIRRGNGGEQSQMGFVICIAFAAAAFAGPLIVAQPGNLLLWIFGTSALLETSDNRGER
jgi:O-antigen ligase